MYKRCIPETWSRLMLQMSPVSHKCVLFLFYIIRYDILKAISQGLVDSEDEIDWSACII